MKNNDWAPITPALAASASAGASVANALIWAAVILGVSMVLDGSPQAGRVLNLLGGGAAGSLIVLGGWLRVFRRRHGQNS